MDLESIEKEILAELQEAATLEKIEAIQTKYLGRKEGLLTGVLRSLGNLPPTEKKALGQKANDLRTKVEELISTKKTELGSVRLNQTIQSQRIDLTLPGSGISYGHEHPLLSAIREITSIFQKMGFESVEGPEVESDQYNFSDLNIPADHPARDMHDTFYVKEGVQVRGEEKLGPLLLRTHTSPVQIRLMKTMQPPIRIISPGRVFRHEATDATHAAIFHQVEGLAVDKNLSMPDLKGTLTDFAGAYFGGSTKVRFNPSYFPFVEPGAQMDVECFVCHGSKEGALGQPCSLCKATGWLEMLGAGMVHPQVLRNVGYDPEIYTGFAFGMGVERLVMTRLQVRDIRLFLEADLRFLEQF
jgi:phenylalanyl-tRNA synthetase alpha chain